MTLILLFLCCVVVVVLLSSCLLCCCCVVVECRSNCDPAVGNVLRKHYKKPYFLPEDVESSKTDWIFMGSPNYGAHMHVSYGQ